MAIAVVQTADMGAGLKLFTQAWDMETGTVIKTWPKELRASFSPAHPTLALLEESSGGTRLGLWDFSAEAPEKK